MHGHIATIQPGSWRAHHRTTVRAIANCGLHDAVNRSTRAQRRHTLALQRAVEAGAQGIGCRARHGVRRFSSAARWGRAPATPWRGRDRLRRRARDRRRAGAVVARQRPIARGPAAGAVLRLPGHGEGPFRSGLRDQGGGGRADGSSPSAARRCHRRTADGDGETLEGTCRESAGGRTRGAGGGVGTPVQAGGLIALPRKPVMRTRGSRRRLLGAMARRNRIEPCGCLERPDTQAGLRALVARLGK